MNKYIELNECQTPLAELHLEDEPDEIQEQFWDFFYNVPYIQSLVTKDRPKAKDLPRDSSGKIIIDITQPHILENMDYFRPSAIQFQQTGMYTKLRPNSNPKSPFGQWLIEETKRCRYGYVRPEDGEWITGDYYYFLNYAPMSLVKKESKDSKKGRRVIDFPNVWEGHYLKFHAINQAREQGHHYAELASRGKGKAHPYSQIVYTPEGTKTWGDIKVGDLLYGDDGKTTKVIDIPFDKVTSIYTVTLEDGRTVDCSLGHLFKVKDAITDKVSVMSVDDLLSARETGVSLYQAKSFYIPNHKGVEFEAKALTIDPYTTGVCLGKNQTPQTRLPRELMFNSREVRLSLLRGLMDAKGTIQNGIPVLSLYTRWLQQDVAWLCRSLGYNVEVQCDHSYDFEGWSHCAIYKLHIFTKDPIFSDDRSLEQLQVKRLPREADWIKIIDIKYKSLEHAKCVTVDNESHCYLIGEFVTTHNSFSAASMLARRFNIGEDEEVNRKVTCYVTADDKKYLVNGDQTLDKFLFDVDWTALYMEWPAKRLINSLTNMQWMKGYKDVESGTNQGTLNAVVGVTSKDDPAKLRGSRGVLYIIEEFGTFPALLNLWSNLRPSVEDGDDVFGLIMAYGTAGDKDSDFSSAQELVNNPEGYNILAFDNVWDKAGQGKKKFAFFFPGYLNMANCYDNNGNSDVTKALLAIVKDRWWVKYHVTDINAITKRVAEIPVTPQEAMLRTRGNRFPVTQLTLRLNDMDNNPDFHSATYVGELLQDSAGTVIFAPNNDLPIRDYPIKDNKERGAIEIWEMPLKDSTGVMRGRYIIGHDPVDADMADSASLTSTFVFDTFTDLIVAEYTGRQEFADDNFEIVRKLCLFYNAKCLYEQNKKGLFAYFKKMNCLYLLADTPEYLKDIDVVKTIGYGNQSKGVNATANVNNYADSRICDWLLKPIVINNADSDEPTTVPMLFTIKSRALLKELIAYNPDINVDRVRALGMVMLLREERLINGQAGENRKVITKKEDDYFTKNYDAKFKK